MATNDTSILPILKEGAPSLGLTLNERQLEQFQLYYETLVDWNGRVNLTAITDYDQVQVRHFLDSLTVGAALVRASGGNVPPPSGFRLLDIGTGAGFPGLPLKIVWPQIRLTLADSIGKKTAFLAEVVRLLGLTHTEVITMRAEELGLSKAHRERYDVVTARAVASLPVLCEYCLPFVKIGGWMLCPKKGDISLEVEDAHKVARILGGSEPVLHPFVLPGEEEERFVIAVKKVRPTPQGYPRRVGLAKAEPLGKK
jgi:16S rRNA (guanine527-N7)-methyltransferase